MLQTPRLALLPAGAIPHRVDLLKSDDASGMQKSGGRPQIGQYCLGASKTYDRTSSRMAQVTLTLRSPWQGRSCEPSGSRLCFAFLCFLNLKQSFVVAQAGCMEHHLL